MCISMMRRNIVLFYATWNEAGEVSGCGGRWGKAGKKWVLCFGGVRVGEGTGEEEGEAGRCKEHIHAR